MSGKRLDPEDGKAYTWEELAGFYKGKYKKAEIEWYWEACKPARSKGKGKGDASVEPKAKAKTKAKAKAKVKAKESANPRANLKELQQKVSEWRTRATKAEETLEQLRRRAPEMFQPLGTSTGLDGFLAKPASLLYEMAAIERGMARMEKALPIVFTIYTRTGGTVGPELRAIVKHGTPPPTVTGTNAPVKMRGRGRPITEGVTKNDPCHFPVDVYYVKLDPKAEYAAGELNFAGQNIPKITHNPTYWAVLGDTGLRVKKAEKQFQPLDTWAAPMVGRAQAEEKPDLVVHMGDYVYREGPGEEGCASINEAAEWGHSMYCWFAEFFEPFRPLLDAAPWIAARGNHENAARMGPGWHYLLGTDDFNPDNDWSDPLRWCPKFAKPLLVEFQQSVVYSIDNGDHHELSIDHYNFKDSKFAAIDPTQPIVIDPDNNYHTDVNVARDDNLLQEAYHAFSQHATTAAAAGKHTFLLQHIPAFAVMCDGPNWVGYNPNVQRSFWEGWANPSSLKAILSGHMHWYQRWAGRSPEVYMPAQFVIGNSGTMLIPEFGVPPKGLDQTVVLQKTVPGSEERLQIPIEGLIVRGYGYSMFRQEAGKFQCVHYQQDEKGSFKSVDTFSL